MIPLPFFRPLLAILTLACLLSDPILARAHANLERSGPPNNAV
jgi:hypothetical protein